MFGRPTPTRRAWTGGGRSLIVAVVTSMSMGFGSSTQSGCSLAVNVDGLSANQQDGSPREAGTVDVGVGPEAPSSPGPMDAHEPDTDGARDSQMADGEEHDGANPVDRGASDTTPAAADARTTPEEMDAGAPDTSSENQDADAASAMNDPSDAATTDTATGDLSTAGDVEPGPSGDAASDRGGEAVSDPPACEPSPLVSLTLELANAPSAQTACGYVPGEVPRFFAAVDSTVFNGSAACGA